MNPLELEKFHQIKNVIGVNLMFYEYLFTIDTDTMVNLLRFTPILFFWTYLFFSHDYSSFPCHRPADHTCLHNCFLPSTSSDFYDSSSFTHCTSLQFHHIPPHSNRFVIVLDFLKSQVYKPSTCYMYISLS